MNTMTHIDMDIFWLSLALLSYTYLGYPIILFVCYALAQLYSDILFLMVAKNAESPESSQVKLSGVIFSYRCIQRRIPSSRKTCQSAANGIIPPRNSR